MSRVWVVGDTIRRERGAHSAAVAELLRHLERRGHWFSPRHLGVDGQGRDILSRLPGVPVPTLRGEEQLEEVGAILRALHDAVADFRPGPAARWRGGGGPLGPDEIILHGDVGPWNMLEQEGRITGLVNFDSARPGRPVEDFAYAAWHLVPLHAEAMGDGTSGPQERLRPRRLRILADAYRLAPGDRVAPLSEVAAMQVTQAAAVAGGSRRGDAALRRLWGEGRFTAATARSLLWLDRHREDLSAALL